MQFLRRDFQLIMTIINDNNGDKLAKLKHIEMATRIIVKK